MISLVQNKKMYLIISIFYFVLIQTFKFDSSFRPHHIAKYIFNIKT